MRYVFVFLAFMVVYRAMGWIIRDLHLRRQVMQKLPDAGYIGAFYVMSGESRRMEEGDEIRLPCEGTLGSANACDVCVHHRSVPAKAAIFWLEKDGLHMVPADPEGFLADGTRVGPGDEAVLLHGAAVCVGEVLLQLRLFSGVELLGALDADGEPYVTPEARKRASRGKKLPIKGKARRKRKETGAPEAAMEKFEADKPSERPVRARQTVSQKPQAKAPAARKGGKTTAERGTAKPKRPVKVTAAEAIAAKPAKRKRKNGAPDDNPIYGGNDDD